jgi:hypothetical protein
LFSFWVIAAAELHALARLSFDPTTARLARHKLSTTHVNLFDHTPEPFIMVTMVARRAFAQARSNASVPRVLTLHSRSFAAVAAAQNPARAPALADITPDGAASFNKKQLEFREGLVAAQKKREQQESAFASQGSALRVSLSHAVPSIANKRTY